MVALLIFAIALFVSALISELAHRSIVSSTVLFLVVGFFAGPDFIGAINLEPQSGALSSLAEIAMFVVLFTDGMELTGRRMRRGWRLPTLALFIGLPLTLLGFACLAHFVAGIDWLPALLVGAVLSPTDPVFASAIVAREAIPKTLRDLLNIESGLNDGLALPLVVALLALLTQHPFSYAHEALSLLLGGALGIAVPWLAHWLEQRDVFNVSTKYEPLFAVALGLFVYAAAGLAGANLYIAAFAAGVTISSVQPRFARTFCEFGEVIAEILKLATVMVFGALISPRFLSDVPLSGYMFAVLALLVVRPVALEIALHRARLTAHERAAAYWFGPKGFASIVYGIMVLRANIGEKHELFRLIAIVVALSILAHSSTDVLVARWFEPGKNRGPAGAHPPDAAAA